MYTLFIGEALKKSFRTDKMHTHTQTMSYQTDYVNVEQK